MAVGAEKRLEDYHVLRNTYETVSLNQEFYLNNHISNHYLDYCTRNTIESYITYAW